MADVPEFSPEVEAAAAALLAQREAAAQQTTAPQPVVDNPLMARIKLPGETFTLPSGGAFYHNGELASHVTGAEVHVYPMTAIDEVVLKTPDMLYSGKAVTDVFSRCIPDVANPEQLLAKDVDFLLLCLRKVSYGNAIEIITGHPGCKSPDTKRVGDNSYMVDVTDFIRGSKRIDATKLDQQFSVFLDNGQVVKMSPIRYANYIAMMQAQDSDSDMSVQEQVDIFTETILHVVVSVDDVTNKAFIKEWLAGLPPMYMSKITDVMSDNVQWGPDYKFTVSCKDCGETQEVVAPMNPLAFFS